MDFSRDYSSCGSMIAEGAFESGQLSRESRDDHHAMCKPMSRPVRIRPSRYLLRIPYVSGDTGLCARASRLEPWRHAVQDQPLHAPGQERLHARGWGLVVDREDLFLEHVTAEPHARDDQDAVDLERRDQH